MNDQLADLGMASGRTSENTYSIHRDTETGEFHIVSNTGTLGHIHGTLDEQSIEISGQLYDRDDSHETVLNALTEWGLDETELTVDEVDHIEVSYTTVELGVTFADGTVGVYRFSISTESMSSETNFGQVA